MPDTPPTPETWRGRRHHRPPGALGPTELGVIHAPPGSGGGLFDDHPLLLSNPSATRGRRDHPRTGTRHLTDDQWRSITGNQVVYDDLARRADTISLNLLGELRDLFVHGHGNRAMLEEELQHFEAHFDVVCSTKSEGYRTSVNVHTENAPRDEELRMTRSHRTPMRHTNYLTIHLRKRTASEGRVLQAAHCLYDRIQDHRSNTVIQKWTIQAQGLETTRWEISPPESIGTRVSHWDEDELHPDDRPPRWG